MSLVPRIMEIVRIAPLAVAAFVLGAVISAAPSATLAAGKVASAAKRAEPIPTPSRVRVTPPSEPGTPLTLHVRIEDAATGRPISGAQIFVYQTDDEGFYRKGKDGREQGPRESRLRATAHSDSLGSVVFDTVVPGSYPGSGIFRHIHYSLTAAGHESRNKEIILDEAPKPTEEQKRWAERNGDVVAKRANGEGGRSEIRLTITLQAVKEG